ncbi:hypothetical protein [Mangrovicoccus algicola]|uniref:Uncharacterized protein n=1 Tax=Mangrovicoccus algicola TaxID=2771008 RepID=A0A8J6YVD2_9RHOB|nr:hypothetical protein [Mangrovicoccus algicola]MBE3636874.1 hypothetical protein [Mangrovicoccus algicola]
MGWHHGVQAPDGNTYSWYEQDRDNSCACACIAMMAKAMQNRTLDEQVIRSWCGRAEGAVNKSKEGVRDYDNIGTQLDIIGTVLSEYLRVTTLPLANDAGILRILRQARPAKPVLTGVYWYTQTPGQPPVWLGGHAVLAMNFANNRVTFLDPGYGVYMVDEGDLNAYEINYGNGLSTGVIGAVRGH